MSQESSQTGNEEEKPAVPAASPPVPTANGKPFKLGSRQSPSADPRRERRMKALVDTFVVFDDDIDSYKQALTDEETAKWIAEDKRWFEVTFRGRASAIMETGIIMNLFSMATAKNAQTLPASKVILPAINKRRYNLGVQKQEVANEGTADLLSKVSHAPMSHIDVVNILVQNGNLPKETGLLIEQEIRKPPEVIIPSLEEAIEHAKTAQPHRLLESRTITEEKDLAIEVGGDDE